MAKNRAASSGARSCQIRMALPPNNTRWKRLKLRYAVPNPEPEKNSVVSGPFLAQHRYRTVIRYLSKSKQSKYFAALAKNFSNACFG